MSYHLSSCTAVLASAFILVAATSNGQTQSNQHQQSNNHNFYITTPQTGERTPANSGGAATQRTANTYIAQTAWSQPAASAPQATTRQVSNQPARQATQQQQYANYYANTSAQTTGANYYTTQQYSQQATQQSSRNQQVAEQTIYPAAYVSNASNNNKGFFNRLLHRDHNHAHTTKAASSPVQAAKNMAYSASKLAGTMQSGVASWYGGKWHGRKTANGERYNQESMTAAHRSLPFGTVVKVTNERNGRECTVRINNRGPFTKGRILDLSKAAARHLGMVGSGVAKVKMEVVGKS